MAIQNINFQLQNESADSSSIIAVVNLAQFSKVIHNFDMEKRNSG